MVERGQGGRGGKREKREGRREEREGEREEREGGGKRGGEGGGRRENREREKSGEKGEKRIYEYKSCAKSCDNYKTNTFSKPSDFSGSLVCTL